MAEAAEARRKDLIDLGARLEEKLKEGSVGNGEREAIKEILERIEGGDEFKCDGEDCDELIPILRIEHALPAPKFCCPCQKKKDKKRIEPQLKEVIPSVLVVTSDHK